MSVITTAGKILAKTLAVKVGKAAIKKGGTSVLGLASLITTSIFAYKLFKNKNSKQENKQIENE
tara:strand:- start:419 stop:610 length:192 start_codon:yes stop_codon:yes gene_type:complete